MTKSMPPSSLAHRSAAAFKLSAYLNRQPCSVIPSKVPPPGGGTITYVADIAASNSYNFGAFPRGCYVRCGSLRLLLITTYDAGVRSKGNQGPGLSAADGSGTSGDERNPALYYPRVRSGSSVVIIHYTGLHRFTHQKFRLSRHD